MVNDEILYDHRTGVFAAPSWDGFNPVIVCAGWDAAQAWRNFDSFVTKNKEKLFEHQELLDRFNKLKPDFRARRSFYKRIGVTIIFGRYDFDSNC